MKSLGLIMIVRNEQANLPRSLEPVAQAFEQIVVVDSGSSDNTVELARALGAEVHHITWRDDFAYARNHSIKQAKTDWLLWLDADNRIEGGEAAVSELRQMLPAEPAIIWGLEKLSGSGELLWQKRVFPRLPEVAFRGLVHEQLVHPPGWLQISSALLIEHWGYEDPDKVRRKGHYYLGLLQKSLRENPQDYYARFQAARCYFNLRDFISAEAQLELASREESLFRENPELGLHVEIMRASAWERLGRAEEALRLLRRLGRRCPYSPLPFFHAGKLAYARGDYQLASQALRQSLQLHIGAPLIDLNPHKVRFTAFYLLGLALARLGQSQDAAESLGQALEMEPRHRGLRLDLAELLWNMDNKTSAMAHLRAVREEYPQDGRVRRLARKWEEHG